MRDHRQRGQAGLFLLLLGMFAGTAGAVEPGALIGKWIERFANGNGMVTEFTATTLVSYPVDAAGKPMSSGPPSPVTYRALDANTIKVEFGGGAGILVLIKDPNTLELDFPGMGAHRLVRMGP